MKKKHPIILSFLIIIVIILGWKSLERPRQIGFLKKHEEELTTFIKKYSTEDEDITFHWDTVKVGTGMAFESRYLVIRFDIENSADKKYNDQGYTLRINTNVRRLQKIDKLMVLNDPIVSNIMDDENS